MLRFFLCCAVCSVVTGFNGASVLDRIPVFVDAGGFAISAPVDPTGSDLLTEYDDVAEPSGVRATVASTGAASFLLAARSLNRQAQHLSDLLRRNKGAWPDRALDHAIRKFLVLAGRISDTQHRQPHDRHVSLWQKEDDIAQQQNSDLENERAVNKNADGADRFGSVSANESTVDKWLSNDTANTSSEDEGTADHGRSPERELPPLDPIGEGIAGFDDSTAGSTTTRAGTALESQERNLTTLIEHQALVIAAMSGELLVAQSEFHEANDTLVEEEANASQAQKEDDAAIATVDADQESLEEAVSQEEKVSQRTGSVQQSVERQRREYNSSLEVYQKRDDELLERTLKLEHSTEQLNQSKKHFVEMNARYDTSRRKDQRVVEMVQASHRQLEKTHDDMAGERADLVEHRSSQVERQHGALSLNVMPKVTASQRPATRSHNIIAIWKGASSRSSPCTNSSCQVSEQSGAVSKNASDAIVAVQQSTASHQEKIDAEKQYSKDLEAKNIAAEAVNQQIVQVALAHEDCEQKKEKLDRTEAELSVLESQDAYWRSAVANRSARLNESLEAQRNTSAANADSQNSLAEAQAEADKHYAKLMATQAALQKAIERLEALNEELLQVQSELYDDYDVHDPNAGDESGSSDVHDPHSGGDSGSSEQDTTVDKTTWILVLVGLATFVCASIVIFNLRVFNGS